jgi:hypothetical protein
MKWLRRYWPYLLLALLVAGNAGVWIRKDQIADWWRLRNYRASSEVAVLATDTTMTGWGRHLFYVNHPTLEGKEAFNRHCSNYGEETAVLGCYLGDRQGIYLYAVTDSRLEGVRQVTAAHEMLHQAYDRLGSKERKRVGKLLWDFYNNHLADESIRTKLASYKEQGADLANEMHSIFGTEIRTLTPELESYYKEYFDDRLKVVSHSEAYQAEFTRRQTLADQYDAQMKDLKSQFDANQKALDEKSDYLKTKEKEANQALADGNRSKYEAAVNEYNDMVRSYNAQLAATRKIAEEYKSIALLRNEIIVQENQLQDALDSSLGSEQQEQ